jgi:hypothetical protein
MTVQMKEAIVLIAVHLYMYEVRQLNKEGLDNLNQTNSTLFIPQKGDRCKIIGRRDVLCDRYTVIL